MWAQRRAKGGKREPKGSPAGAIFTYLFVIVSGFVFQLFFGWFWSRFGRYFALFWVVILGIVSDIEKKARPHESAVNSSQIEGRAPWKTTKKLLKIEGKRLTGICTQFYEILLELGSILEAF